MAGAAAVIPTAVSSPPSNERPLKPRDPVRDRLGWRGQQNVRRRLIADQSGECFYCLRRMYWDWREAPDLKAIRTLIATIDHIEPLSKGGTWKRYNLCAACRECNNRKGSMSEEEFHEIIMEELSRSSFSCEDQHA